MYSLDINFLNDRPELKPDVAARTRTKSVATDSKTPLYLGIAAGVLIPGIVAAIWLVLISQNNRLQEEQAQLDSRLSTLKAQLGEVEQLRARINQTQTETQALASVFNQIKPWSAMAQDIRDRIPAGIQITRIQEVDPPPGSAPAPAPSPAPGAPAGAAPPPASVIQISGFANSFDNVNDFLLTLQRSNFTNPDETQLVKAELGRPNDLQPISLEGAQNQQSGGNVRPPKLPPRVEFQIQTSLNNVPTSELVNELERKGAVGLVTRIETLQQKGIIAPEKGGTK
jgi:type IV pilus assembly protein PilN